MTFSKQLVWDVNTTPCELHPVLQELGNHYAISGGQDGVIFVRSSDDRMTVECQSDKVTVTYPHLPAATRAVSYLMTGNTEPVCERSAFKTMGIMLDCSRNAVPTLDYLKEFVRRMALFGFNRLMLYTEDTYQLEGEPFFGYQRGGYSKSEIRELDDYTYMFGIELLPCIQTLGHMEQVLRWDCYSPIRDQGAVLLVGEEKTYALINKIADFWSDAVRSRRIHIGMDETHDLGRGQYLVRHGAQPKVDILLRHIERVHKICEEHGLRPMIWSDMLVPHSNVNHSGMPTDVARRIPVDMDLACWNYYQESEEYYVDLIARHGDSHNVLFSSAVWSWGTPWYGCEYTEKRLPPAFSACRKLGVQDVLVTMWNDDGACGDIDSCWNGLALASEDIYGGGRMKERYAAVLDVEYDRNCKIAVMNDEFSAFGLLWDDPLLGIYWHQRRAIDGDYWQQRLACYGESLAIATECNSNTSRAGDIPKLRELLIFLMEKIKLRNELESAVASSSKEVLPALAERYRQQARLVHQLSLLWREHWLSRYKPFGLEVLQNRLAAQAGRQEETARRLEELTDGTIETIPELNASDICCAKYMNFTWRGNVSGSIIM